MKLAIIICALLIHVHAANAASGAGCKAWDGAEDINGILTLYGDPDTTFGGNISTYIAVNTTADPTCKKPFAVGLRIAKDTFENLPSSEEIETMKGMNCTPSVDYGCVPSQDVDIYYPLNNTAFTIITELNLAYAPIGHAFNGVYNESHFDIHFRILPHSEFEKINVKGNCSGGTSPEAFAYGNLPIPVDCFPSGEGNFASGRLFGAGQGQHFIDMNAPENVAGLTELEPDVSLWNQTFIYGGLGGKIAFWEPMIKISYLTNITEEDCYEIANPPLKVFTAGYYPTAYCVKPTEDSVLVYLKDFVEMEEGCNGGGNGTTTEFAPGSYYDYLPVTSETPPLPPAGCPYAKLNPSSGGNSSAPAPAPVPASAPGASSGGSSVSVVLVGLVAGVCMSVFMI